jgi:phosphate starvation-inducible PhoH-like protein
MANKKQPQVNVQIPKNLDKHIFFDFKLDDKQKIFRDSIWDNEKTCVMVNAKAGTGKTTIAVAMGLLMCEYGLYNGIVYVFSPCRERDIGYRPGTTEEKMSNYTESLYNAIVELNRDPNKLISSTKSLKTGEGIIEAIPHTFLRGVNFKNKFVIIEECQNYPFDELKKTLTRIHDTCKVVCIGHTGQIDYKTEGTCGFERYLKASEGVEYISVCELDVNYRGRFSQWADDVT